MMMDALLHSVTFVTCMHICVIRQYYAYYVCLAEAN